ncbi:CU044_5270 family protein [Streptomyces sp. Pv4-95]|uniref:CU044_5270 family protein n=1 Tax=Streptomyces sp. Pv4-95 TaxID=3049543 RepID=UPI0038928AF6
MTDELDVLRAADPVRADAGPWRDRPLDARAEFALHRLLTSKRARQARRRLVLRAEAAVLVLVAVLAYTFSGAGAAPAAAAPSPIVPRSATGSVPLEALARRAEEVARSAGRDAGPRRGSHLQTWYLSMEAGPDAAPPDTVPQERLTRWRPDGGGAELVAATDPRHPGRTVIDDAGGSWRIVNNGKVLRRTTYPAGSRTGDNAAGRPPAGPAALRAHLAAHYGGSGPRTPQLLSALSSFLQEWTPGPRETAAVVRLLAGTGGLRPAGPVTDRLGRHGQAYVYDGPDGALDATRQMVILDPRSGRLLGSEITFTKDLPDFRISSGEVLSYEAWMP